MHIIGILCRNVKLALAGIVVGDAGTVYVAGWTFSSGFATPGAVDATYGGNRDTFLAILDRHRVYLPVVMRQYP